MRNRPSTVTTSTPSSRAPSSSTPQSNRLSYQPPPSQPDFLTGTDSSDAPPPPSYHDALRSPVQRGEETQARRSAQQNYQEQVSAAQQQQQQADEARRAEEERVRAQQQQQQQAASASAGTRPGPGSHVRRNSVEDPLAPLRRHHVLFLVDDSPSMSEGDGWAQVSQAVGDILASAVKYDRDLPDIHFMNNEDRSIMSCSGPEVLADAMRSIQLFGSTPTGYRIDDLLRPYIERVESSRGAGVGGSLHTAPQGERVKPWLLVVLTDGKADDPDMVRDVIVEFAQRLSDVRAPPTQLGVQFVQIGNDREATEFLQTLDDDLGGEHGVRDMVDTTPYQGRVDSTFLAKALLGAINRRLDATGESANRESRRVVSA